MSGDLTLFSVYFQITLIKYTFLLTNEDVLFIERQCLLSLNCEKTPAHTITTEKEIHLEMNSNFLFSATVTYVLV